MKWLVVCVVLVFAVSPAAANDPAFELTAGVIHLPDGFAPEVTTGVGFKVPNNVSLGVRLRAFRDHVPEDRRTDVARGGYNLTGVTGEASARIDFAERRFWLAAGLGLADIGQEDLYFGGTEWTVAAALEGRAGFTFARSDKESLAVSLGIAAYVAGEGEARTWSAALGYQFN